MLWQWEDKILKKSCNMFNKDKISKIKYYRDKLCLNKWIRLGEHLKIKFKCYRNKWRWWWIQIIRNKGCNIRWRWLGYKKRIGFMLRNKCMREGKLWILSFSMLRWWNRHKDGEINLGWIKNFNRLTHRNKMNRKVFRIVRNKC